MPLRPWSIPISGLTIADLDGGVDVAVNDCRVEVGSRPTYSGCSREELIGL